LPSAEIRRTATRPPRTTGRLVAEIRQARSASGHREIIARLPEAPDEARRVLAFVDAILSLELRPPSEETS
jgi:hypothetical protein